MTDYVTVQDVELMSAGMAWKGGAVYYVTAEHLADMVTAQADPLIRNGRVKLGHTDKLFGALAGTHNPTPDSVDGEPAFGTVTNLRTVEAGAKLVGDLTEVPDWLAAAMPSAYPTRSAEWIWDHTTSGGRKYTAVFTDIALGGVWEPAVEDLADITREQATAALQALLEQGPEGIDALVAAAREETTMPAAKGATASVSVDRIAALFNEWVESEPIDGLDTYWWWARDVRVDPDEVIACDGEGGTFRVPFTTDGEHDVTFADPVEVRQTYVDVTGQAAAAAAAGARTDQQVLAHDLPRPISKQDRPNPAASRPDNERNPMDESVRKALAAAHGLNPDTATEDEVNAAVLAAQTDADAAAAAEAERLAAEAEEVEEDEETPEAEVEVPATVNVSQEVYEEQQRRLEALEADKAERELAAATVRRDGLVDKWVRERRITPAERALARNNLDIDEKKTVETYEALATNRVPTTTRGGSDDGPSATSGSDALVAASRARMGHTPKEA